MSLSSLRLFAFVIRLTVPNLFPKSMQRVWTVRRKYFVQIILFEFSIGRFPDSRCLELNHRLQVMFVWTAWLCFFLDTQKSYLSRLTEIRQTLKASQFFRQHEVMTKHEKKRQSALIKCCSRNFIWNYARDLNIIPPKHILGFWWCCAERCLTREPITI